MRGSSARKALQESAQKSLIKQVVQHSAQLIYTRVTMDASDNVAAAIEVIQAEQPVSKQRLVKFFKRECGFTHAAVTQYVDDGLRQGAESGRVVRASGRQGTKGTYVTNNMPPWPLVNAEEELASDLDFEDAEEVAAEERRQERELRGRRHRSHQPRPRDRRGRQEQQQQQQQEQVVDLTMEESSSSIEVIDETEDEADEAARPSTSK